MSDLQPRREARLPIESIVLPFFGSRGTDYQPFDYLIQDVSPGGVKIAIPSWVLGRERIHQGERVNLHVPFELEGKVLYSGVAAWQKPDEDGQGQIVGLIMDQARPLSYPVFFSVSSRQLAIDLTVFESRGSLLAKIAKDAYLLKRGCLIYLKHLSAFFSRISDLSHEEYKQFRDFVFDDIIARTQKNADHLFVFHEKMAQAKDSLEDACAVVDLAELRQAVEPEMYIELFKNVYTDSFAMQYLYAIKELENKLYISYNSLVLVYCSTL
ncbi:MAG: PilZ domain-containing protein [Desulfovibrio sp.]|nr:PilZ domain-containing protein [Desulfovibrio sp.]MBI4960753.1 PilZ domain-containing protein [Desulfovibrio sp.]